MGIADCKNEDGKICRGDNSIKALAFQVHGLDDNNRTYFVNVPYIQIYKLEDSLGLSPAPSKLAALCLANLEFCNCNLYM